MMHGISQCCRECTDRYPACHDYCEKYQEASEKWKSFKKQVKDEKFDEYFAYKVDKIKKEEKKRRGKTWQMK